MSIYIYTRENIKLFKQACDQPERAVIYGSNFQVVRPPLNHSVNRVGDVFCPLKYEHMTDEERQLAIYIPTMVLPNNSKIKKIKINKFMTKENMNILLSYMTRHPEIKSIIYHTYLHLISLDKKINVLIKNSDYSGSLTEFTNISYTKDDKMIEIKGIDKPEIYYILSRMMSLLPYEMITGKEFKISYAELFRHHKKWAIKNLGISHYSEIYEALIQEADLYDDLYQLTLNYIEKFKDNYDKVQKAYFNAGFILSSQINDDTRDLALDYLFKAGDLPEAKRLRTRLFLERIGLPFNTDIEINLDYQTLLKIGLMIKR